MDVPTDFGAPTCYTRRAPSRSEPGLPPRSLGRCDSWRGLPDRPPWARALRQCGAQGEAAGQHSTVLRLRPLWHGTRPHRNAQCKGAQAGHDEPAGPLGVEGEEQAETALPQALPPCQLHQEVPLGTGVLSAREGGLGWRDRRGATVFGGTHD